MNMNMQKSPLVNVYNVKFIISCKFYCLIPLMSWGGGGWMIEVMFEVMLYFGLNHRPSSGVKLKLNEL